MDIDFCFKTFPVDKITIPALSDYTIYYAPNDTEGIYLNEKCLAPCMYV